MFDQLYIKRLHHWQDLSLSGWFVQANSVFWHFSTDFCCSFDLGSQEPIAMTQKADFCLTHDARWSPFALHKKNILLIYCRCLGFPIPTHQIWSRLLDLPWRNARDPLGISQTSRLMWKSWKQHVWDFTNRKKACIQRCFKQNLEKL